MAERGYRHLFAYLEARLHVAFNLLQMGRVEEGRDTYLGTMTELRRRGPSGGWEMPMDVESFIEWGTLLSAISGRRSGGNDLSWPAVPLIGVRR